MNDMLSMNNLMFGEKVPQKQILYHSKTKLFITHCGFNGVIEALYFGKPMLGFP